MVPIRQQCVPLCPAMCRADERCRSDSNCANDDVLWTDTFDPILLDDCYSVEIDHDSRTCFFLLNLLRCLSIGWIVGSSFKFCCALYALSVQHEMQLHSIFDSLCSSVLFFIDFFFFVFFFKRDKFAKISNKTLLRRHDLVFFVLLFDGTSWLNIPKLHTIETFESQMPHHFSTSWPVTKHQSN